MRFGGGNKNYGHTFQTNFWKKNCIELPRKLETCTNKIPQVSMVGCGEGQACADLGVMTRISVSGIYY
jgi:hypothetical protein